MHPSCERPAQDDAGLAVVAQPLELCPAFLAMGRDLAHPNLVTNHLNWLGALSLAPEKKKGFSFLAFTFLKRIEKKEASQVKTPCWGINILFLFSQQLPHLRLRPLKCLLSRHCALQGHSIPNMHSFWKHINTVRGDRQVRCALGCRRGYPRTLLKRITVSRHMFLRFCMKLTFYMSITDIFTVLLIKQKI